MVFLSPVLEWPAKAAENGLRWLFRVLVKECTFVLQCRKNVDELEKVRQKYVSPFEGHIYHARYDYERPDDETIERLKQEEDATTGAADKLLKGYKDANEKNHLRFCGYVPNPFLRHKYGKQARIKTMAIERLQNTKPDRLTRPNVPPGMIIPPDTEDDYLPESRAEILNRIIKALEDPNIQKIGVWVAPHMGRTILRKKLVQRVLREGHFHIRAESENPDDVQKIQHDIADYMALEKFSQIEGARKKQNAIRTRLTKKDEKVLIILDGLSKRIDLINKVGIPLDDKKKVCKVILISADQNLLLKEMDVPSKHLFRLGVLPDTDSEALFQAIVGEMHGDDPEKKAIAREIVEESAGFPDLIADQARHLKNQPSLGSWKDARERIRSEGPQHIRTHVEEILELNSDAKELRTLIPLCSHFGGPVISVQDLTIHGKGLGLFDHIDTLEATRNRVKYLIDILCDYQLVDEDKEHVKVKNLIRRVSLSQEEKRKCTKMSIDKANTQDSQWPELKMLLLHAEAGSWGQYLQIPTKFFTNMKELTVLRLTNINFASSPIPSSIKDLVKLQTLYLDCCKLNDVRIIGNLVTLQHLSFSGSDIARLPKELGELTELRLLDLRRCHKIRVIKAGVLNRLTRLEELYLDDSFDHREVLHPEANLHGEDTKKASLDELSVINKLSTLHINVTDATRLPQKMTFENLKSYKILLGDIRDLSKDENEQSRTLKLSLPTTAKGDFLSRKWMRKILERSEYLYLKGNIDDIRRVDELSSEGFPVLKHLHVQDIRNIECVLVGKSNPTFTTLESLTLANLAKLKKICFDNLDSGSFKKLKVLKIQHCDELEHLFKLTLVRVTSNIEKIEVSECKKMKGIVTDETDDEMEHKGHTATEEKVEWRNLKHLTLRGLPEMTSFITVERTASKSSETTRPDTPTAFFDGKQISLPRLESLALIKLPRVKEIWLPTIPSDVLDNLQHLKVEDCESLESVTKQSQLTMLENLRCVTIKNCPLVEEAFQLGSNLSETSKPSTPPQHKSRSRKPIPGRPRSRNGKEKQKTLNGDPETDVLPRLDKLNLIELHSLKCLWKSSPKRIMRFQDLSHLTVHGCHKLEHLFSASMARALPRMNHLCIKNCDMLAVIIHTDMADEESEPQGHDAMTSNSVDLKLTSLSLENLKNLATFSRGIGSLSFPSLKRLKISNCSALTALFNASEQQLMTASSDDDPLSGLVELLFGLQGLLEENEAPEVEDGNAVQVGDADFLGGSLFNQTVTPSFPLLEELAISDMNFRNIWQGQGFQESFPKLLEVSVEACQNLSHIFPQDMLKSFCNIKKLCISSCSSLKNISAVDGETIESINAHEVVARLREICLEGLEKLEHIWPTVDPEGRIIRFTKLQVVSVHKCKTVEYLFPLSLTKDLSELKRLEVNMCDGLEQIIKDDEPTTADDAPIFKFRDLKFLELRRLKNLKNLYAKPHISRWPSLTRLMVVECGSVEIFCSTDNFSPSQRCLFWVDQNPFGELEILELNQNQLMGKILQGQLPPVELFCNLKVFKLMSPKEKPANFPQGFLQCSANLEALEVSNCRFPKYRSPDEQPTGDPESESPLLMSSTFRYGMSLFHLIKASPTVHEEETQRNELMIASNEERIPQGHTSVLQELKLNMLPEVKYFSEGLKYMGTSPDSFRSLKGLEVSECNKLTHLLTISMAKSLPHLTRLTVTKCKIMEEIVARKNKDERENVAYNFLKCLTLDSLPEIKSFGAGNTSFHLSSLEEVIVRQCPRMKKFTALHSRAPNLNKVKIEGEEKTLSDYDGNLNAVIEKSYAEMAAFPGMKHVKLSEFPEWIEQWGKVRVKTSCLVTNLEISNCHSLLIAVPSKLIDLLGRLEKLAVKNCNRITEVFDLSPRGDQNGGELLSEICEIHLEKLDELDHIWKPGHSLAALSFRSLTSLEVIKCNRLKSIFSIQIALRLQSLEHMAIEQCADLKYIISSDDELKEERTVFPQLESLVLYDLQNLEGFHADHLNLRFRPLKRKPKVYRCPKVKGINKMYSTSDAGYAGDRLDHLRTFPSEIYRSLALYVIICLLFFSFWINGHAFIRGSTIDPFQA